MLTSAGSRLLLAFALQTMAPPERIAAWQAELEKEFNARVPIVWVGRELLGDAEGLQLAQRHLASEGLRAQFPLMDAAMIAERTAGADRFAILLNLDRRDSWRGFEEALLGHEMGHAWLRARRLPAPAFHDGPLACVAVHAGDVVQHVLIRAEMDRRQIDHRGFFMRNLDAAARSLEAAAPAADPCAWVRQAAIWVDARLAFNGLNWPGRDRYEAAASLRFAEAGRAAARLIQSLAGKDLNQPLIHRQALVEAYGVLLELANTQQLPRDD